MSLVRPAPLPTPPAARRGGVVGACWVVVTGLLVGSGHTTPVGPDATIPHLGHAGWWAALAVLSVQAIVLFVARRRPAAALVAVASAVPVLALLGARDATSFGSLMVIVASAAATLHLGVPRVLPVLATAVTLVGVGSAVGSLAAGAPNLLAWGGGALQGLLAVGIPAVVAFVVLVRRDALAAQEARALALRREHAALTREHRALAREHAALVEAAVARERMAMARELHDIAAHHLTGIAVMTGIMERQIDVAPDDAKTAVRQVRQQSTAMLREMRGLVGLLRGPGGTDESVPAGQVESLAGIPALVETASSSGTDVRLDVRGTLDTQATSGVGPLAQLAAYRTVQECLSNAARHAPGAPVEVVVDTGYRRSVTVTVRNAAPTSSGRDRQADMASRGGFGLVGMRERAELTSADLVYGPTDDGGWSVTLTIPVEEDASR